METHDTGHGRNVVENFLHDTHFGTHPQGHIRPLVGPHSSGGGGATWVKGWGNRPMGWGGAWGRVRVACPRVTQIQGKINNPGKSGPGSK
jgi:hypothetical protein